MKVFKLHSDMCNLCHVVRPTGQAYHYIQISVIKPAYSIPFHQDCWDSASNFVDQKIFSHEEWVDFAGPEWDVRGLVETFAYGSAVNWKHNGSHVSKPWFDELSEMED